MVTQVQLNNNYYFACCVLAGPPYKTFSNQFSLADDGGELVLENIQEPSVDDPNILITVSRPVIPNIRTPKPYISLWDVPNIPKPSEDQLLAVTLSQINSVKAVLYPSLLPSS